MHDRLAALALMLVSLALLAALPAWRMTEPPPAYLEPPEAFRARVEAFARGQDVVAPPPGDVLVLAERFRFWPALRLEAGRTYRLHASSMDAAHALAVAGQEVLLVPGEVRVLEITPTGPLDLRCNEYCGLGHNKMRGSVDVTPPAWAPPAAR